MGSSPASMACPISGLAEWICTAVLSEPSTWCPDQEGAGNSIILSQPRTSVWLAAPSSSLGLSFAS